jgi:WD40 repeat protein
MATPSDASHLWPQQQDPKWPRGCLIENTAIHPREPWIAVACTNSEAETGAVLVFDAQTGSLRSSTPIDGYVGWSDPGLLRWHPDGVRLGTNVSTNGIALLDRAELVGVAFPDETRDSGVNYLWIGDEMFTDTGALFQIQQDDWRFEFEELEIPQLQAIEWNAAAKFVVGRVGTGVAAYDPIAKRVVYENTLASFGDRGNPSWSPDGRWCARRQFAVHPASDQLLFVDGNTGRAHGVRTPSSPRIDALAWSPNGSLAVSCYVHHIGGQRTQRHVDIFREGERRTTIDLGARTIQASHGIADASGIAWSPTGEGLALLLDGQRVQVVDAQTGKVLSLFDAPAPAIPAGLPDHYAKRNRPGLGFPGDLMWAHQQRLIRIAPHFVSIWSMDGSRVAQFVVPA